MKSFIENYEFPCVGVLDGFHVYVNSKLRSFYGFKKQYNMSNLELIGYNKKFLYCSVGVPGSTDDSRFQKTLYQTKEGDFRNIPLVTIGDTAFLKHAWLLKGYNEDMRDPKQRYFKTKICSARVVTKNAYGMLKGRLRVLLVC